MYINQFSAPVKNTCSTHLKSIEKGGSTMRASVILPAMAALGQALAQLNNVTTPYLNLTAIAAANGESTLECWQLGPFASSSVPGTAGALNLFLGDMSNATYTVIPPRFDGGLHTAPAVQYVYCYITSF